MSPARTAWLVPGALFTFTCALLAVTRSAELTPDNLGYARSAVTGADMFHPHHLLWIPLVHAAWSGLRAAGFAPDGVLAGQIVSVLAAGVTIAAVYEISRRLLGSPLAAVATAISLLVTRGFWLFSTQAPDYFPSLACLALLCLALMARRDDAGPWRRIWAPALSLAGAVSFHQSTVLIAVPVVIFLLVSEGQRGVASSLKILLPAGAAVLAAYAGAYLWTDAREIVTGLRGSRPTGLEGFVQFLQAYRYHPYPMWGTWANLDGAGIARGVHSQVWNLVAFPPGLVSPAMKGLVTAALGLFSALLLADQSRQVFRSRDHRAARAFLLVWLLTFWTFFLWLVPSTREYFVAPLIPLLLLTVLALKRIWPALSAAARTGVGLLATAVASGAALANLAMAVWPAHLSKGPGYEEARRVAQIAPAGCVVGDDHSVNQHLAYYFDRRRVIEVPLVQLYHYRRSSLPASLALADTACFVVPVALIVPEYAGSGFDGYARPAQWLRFIGWVLDIRSDRDGGTSSGRDFRMVQSNAGPPLLVVLPFRKPIRDLPTLMLELDHVLAARSEPGPGPFMQWWRRVGTRLGNGDSLSDSGAAVPAGPGTGRTA